MELARIELELAEIVVMKTYRELDLAYLFGKADERPLYQAMKQVGEIKHRIAKLEYDNLTATVESVLSLAGFRFQVTYKSAYYIELVGPGVEVMFSVNPFCFVNGAVVCFERAKLLMNDARVDVLRLPGDLARVVFECLW